MKNSGKRGSVKITLIAALLTLALMLSTACAIVAPGKKGKESPAPTKTPEKVVMGDKVKGHEGLTDISDALTGALGEGFNAQSSIFTGENTLLVYAAGEKSDVLMRYDIVTGEALAKYTLPFSYAEATMTFSTGIMQPLEDGGVLLCDPINNEVIKLDETLKEESRVKDILPEFSDGAYGCLAMLYCEREDAFFYATRYTTTATVEKLDMKGKSTEFFTTNGTEDCINSMSLTKDGAYLSLDITGQQEADLKESGTMHHSYVLDTKTGKAVDSTWLKSMAYSNGGKLSVSKYYAATSKLTVDGVKLDIAYLSEYDCVDINEENARAITAAINDDMDSTAFVLSSYSLEDGKLCARVCIDSEGYKPLTASDFDGRLISVDSVTGAVCATQHFGSTDLFSIKQTYVWQPGSAKDEVRESDEYTLRKAKNVEYDPENGVKTLESEIEDEFGVAVYFGDEFRAYMKKHNFDETEVRTFPKGADEQYIYECLYILKEALSQYPKSMLEKVSGTSDGQLAFFICSYLDEGQEDVTYIGQYMPKDGKQNILLNFCGYSPNDFLRGGSTGAFYSMVHHELCHAFQWYFFTLANLKDKVEGGTCYDFDEWNAFYPEDFKFDDAEGIDKYVNGEPKDAYFIDSYAASAITEDMSRLFEHAMWEPLPDVLQREHIKPRLEYLLKIIRTAFADDTWSEQMPWERAIAE